MALTTVLPEVPDAFNILEEMKVYLYKETDAFANPNSPTRPEINAGVDLTAQVAGISGFSVSTAMIDAPNLANKFTPQIGGAVTAEASTMTFNLSKTGADIRAHLNADESGVTGPEATRGWLLLADAGDVAGSLADLWPVLVTSESKPRDMGAVSQVTFTFAITGRPRANVALPATA